MGDHIHDDDTALRHFVFQQIRASPTGSIGFAEFMTLCLYHPDHGYYAHPARRPIGRGGDFFTSVSVGDTYGYLLGLAVESQIQPPYTIVEQGAHDGRLALDIVAGLLERHPPESLSYTICEPDPARGEALRHRLSAEKNGIHIRVAAHPPERPPARGVFFCNELLDALPVSRIRWENGAWREWRVGLNAENALTCQIAPLSEELAAEAGSIETLALPEGYLTEVSPAYDAWMREARRWFGPGGRWWVIDYGHEAADYFAPARREGTLRGFRAHQRVDDLLNELGKTDLTADVNFTRLDRAAAACGLRRSEYTDQHHFLTRAAAPWLRAIEAGGPAALERSRARLRQFQTLTHPSLMGRAFKIAEYIPMEQGAIGDETGADQKTGASH